MTRREFAAAAATGVVTTARADDPPAAPLGLVQYSFGLKLKADRTLADPVRFLEFARERGATAVQLPLGSADPVAVRKACDRLGMHVEGIVSPPKDDADRERFATELTTAKACGADVVRTVLSGGRRYEVFDKSDDFPAFAKRAEATLRQAEPVAREKKVVLAVENHKDYRADELADLLGRLASEWVGACVDTGNNLALLDDPTAAIAALAPFARSVHLKDIAVEESADGFRMSEVPLGRGALDLPGTVAALRAKNPRVRFHLEMLTRDPLSVPCLTDKYWATLGRVPGRDLARALARARRPAGSPPLPRVSPLPPGEQVAAEERNVRESFAFAAKSRLLPG